MGVAVLAQFIIDPQADGRVSEIQQVARDGYRPHRTEAVLRLAEQPLLVRLLHVARGDIVDDGVAPHVVHGVADAYGAPFAADDDGEFRFVIELLGNALVVQDGGAQPTTQSGNSENTMGASGGVAPPPVVSKPCAAISLTCSW